MFYPQSFFLSKCIPDLIPWVIFDGLGSCQERHDTPYNFITRKLGEVLAVLGYSLMRYLIPEFEKIGLEIQELVCLIWCCVCFSQLSW